MPMDSHCRSISVSCGRLKLRFNPVVTILSALIIWGFVIWCMVIPVEALAELSTWKYWVTQKWTWLYVGTQDVWAVFIIILYFSKYSKLKLGKDDEKPEFGDTAYFTMLFAAGIGIGLFYFGVAEPVNHYNPGEYGNRFWGRYTDNQRAQDAMNVTFFHWGIHGWIVYALVGLTMGFVSYRLDLPMTTRSCFYPLVGDKIWGITGDIIDILSVICTMFGVCTSLGIGVIQLNAGLERVNSNIASSPRNQIIIIWGITVLATASVVSGLKVGIRRLSEICFAVGMFLLLIVFFYDDTWFLLNLTVQSCGYYLQWIVQIGFHTDAFAQLGNAPDGRQVPMWMDNWTLFYWGWWIAFAPFVGMFIAKISRGRTIRNFIGYTLAMPIIYVFIWFSIFGGAGLKMERNAELAGIACNSTLGGAGSTQSDNGLWRLSCRKVDDMWFDLITHYDGISGLMSVVSLIGIVLYFITSSDSGSLIIDTLSANGDPDPPVIQRVFWALTEGATATALLWAGGKDALVALRTVSICSGLIYTVLLNFMVVAVWRAIKIEAGDLDPDGPQFTMGIFDPIFCFTKKNLWQTFVAIVAPWWPMGKAAGRLYGGKPWVYMLILATPFYGWAILEVIQLVQTGLAYVGWAIFLGFISYGTGIRSNIREEYGIEGNMAEDFFAVLLLYPLAAIQMQDHMAVAIPGRKDVENGILVGEELERETKI